jgi:hypothetical protein
MLEKGYDKPVQAVCSSSIHKCRQATHRVSIALQSDLLRFTTIHALHHIQGVITVKRMPPKEVPDRCVAVCYVWDKEFAKPSFRDHRDKLAGAERVFPLPRSSHR